jgi:cell division protein FtsL
MRKGLKIHLAFSAIMNLVFLLILFFDKNPFTSVTLGVCLVIIVLHIALSVVFSIYLDVQMRNDWFKSQEQLNAERRQTNLDWNTASEMCQIIGNHEALKMYAEVKKMQNEKKPVL